MYEVPVRIYNISSTSKRISIRAPEHNVFKVDYDRKKKYSQIVPGWYLEILVTFESDVVQDDSDKIVITSENGFKLELHLRASRPVPLVHFEPLINLGFVPVNTKKTETIDFMNDGMVDTRIELKLIEKHSDLQILPPDNFVLMKNTKENRLNRKRTVRICYEPKETNNLHEKIEVTQTTGDETKILGYIEVIATSVYQQLSIVFEEGGGPQTEINFGMLYYGQMKECAAFLVNNGPKEIGYKFFFHPNKKPAQIIRNLDESNFESTPEQAGIEMTQRILSADPIHGNARPYTQIPIRFLCKTKIPDKHKGWRGRITQEYDYMKNPNSRSETNPTTTFLSTAAIKFEENYADKLAPRDPDERICTPITVYMEVKAIFPDITLDKTMLNFWECKLHEMKVIILKITNENEELPVDFSFNKIPHFTVEPSSGIINPVKDTVSIKVKFHPENYGNFSDVLVLRYVNNMYEIPIKVMGICKEKGEKKKRMEMNRNLDEYNSDEELKRYLVPDEKAMDFTKPKKQIVEREAKLKRMYEDRMQVMNNNKSNEEIIRNFGQKFESYERIHEHKIKSNSDIRFREDKNYLINPKARAMQHFSLINEKPDNKDSNGITLLDVLMHDRDNVLDSPRLKLPEAKEDLWVLKPVGKYEPTTVEDNFENKKINFDPDMHPKEKELEKYSRFPRTHKEKKDCEMDLDGFDLQKIQIGDKGELDFREVFIKSEMTRTFWIRNNLRTHIFVQLECDFLELERTNPKSMVIPPSSTQGFNITLFSKEEKKSVSFSVKYIINYKHAFKLKVNASFVLVHIDIVSPPLSTFSFKPEKGDKNQVEMSVRQKLILKNPGNAPANIKWEENKIKAFKVSPPYMIILPKQEATAEFTFTPMEMGSIKEIEDEFKCIVENGTSFTVPVKGKVQPSVVKFQNNNDTLNFENVHIGVPHKAQFHLVNETPKITTAYLINNPRPDVLVFEDAQGYIDKTKSIYCTIDCKEEKDFYEEVEIFIRGGPKIILKIKANVIQPNVFIDQDDFNFGNVAFNEQVIKTMTFKNHSKLDAKVYINLDSNILLRDFKLELSAKYKGDKDYLIKAADKDKQDENLNKSEDESEDGEENYEAEYDNSKTDLREFTVTIPAMKNNNEPSTLDFDFIFCPNNVSLTRYEFMTFFSLAGVEECKGLQRKVSANIIKSAITLSKSEIEFKKTFIYGTDPRFAFEEIRMSNSLTSGRVKWEFLTDELEREGIFMVKEKSGILSENIDASICTVQFSFSPQTKMKYIRKVILLTKVLDDDGDEMMESEAKKTITLIGEGTLPRLYFDKRELILPVVPLGFESSIRFKIKNEGYENTKIRHELRNEMGLIPYTLNYIDDHTIGYMKHELRMELSFKSNKPLSFTARLVFFDEEEHESVILVAGTTDNSLFTNFSFIQRNMGVVDFLPENDGNINLRYIRENDMEYNDMMEDKRSEKNSTSFQGSAVTRSSNAMGYNRIRKEVVEANCRYIKKFLKRVVNPNFVINSFPEDILKDNGKMLFDLITFFTGKEPPGRVDKIDESDSGKKANQIRTQFYEVIKFLQLNGGYLNTVFPEYLMDYSMFVKYVSNDQSRLKIMEPSWDKNKYLKMQWQYIHKESWVLLFYQILKVFYLARVNNKTYMNAILHIQGDANVYEKYKQIKISQSNVYSNNELILLRWLHANYEFVNKNFTKYIHNFSSDLNDGVFLSALILAYFPKVEETIKKKAKSQSELKVLTSQTILDVLKDYGINTHFRSKKKYLEFPQARDMLLFLIILFQNLQHFVVKETIEFSCILGDSVIKAIELKNPLNNRDLEYEIKTTGSPDFIFQGPSDIKIEPGKDVEYQITFKSRITQPVEAYIYFVNKQTGWAKQAAPLVYKLVSKVTGRRSYDQFTIPHPPLYRKTEFKFNIRSPFKEKGDFEMRLYQQKKPPAPKKVKGKMLAPPKQVEKKEEMLYRVFFPKGEDSDGRVFYKLDLENPREITVFFLPVDMDEYECNVVFVKESIGEFQVTINAKAELPLPTSMERWERTCYVDETKEFELDVKMKNKYLDDAISLLKPMDNPVTKKSEKVKKGNLLPNIPDKVGFSVESRNPNFVVSPILYPGNDIFNSKTDGFNTLNSNNNNMNTSGTKYESMMLKLKFQSKVCQIYEGDIIIRNLEKPNDIRVYRLCIDVKPKNIFATFEFICPVKETIVQRIPIYNGSDKDWMVKAELSGHHNGFFKCDYEKKIPRKSQADYSLTFNPLEKVDVTANLILTNMHTKEVYNYTLLGKVDDPLAEGILEFQCNAKEIQKRKIVLENPYGDKDVAYTVETDLPDIVSGPQNFIIRANSRLEYEMTIKPILGKTYFGKITFTDDRKNYKWWTIKVEAKPTYQQQSITMKTHIRKVLYIDIGMENPTNEFIIFHVMYEGEALFGANDLRVEPYKSGIYRLNFSPLKVGQFEGELKIYNEYVGEFIYKLKLVSEDNLPFYPDVLVAELGKSTLFPIPLENPINEEVEVVYSHTNKKLFQIIPDKIILPPFTTKEVYVKYTPSTLESEEECNIKFDTAKIGKWVYNIRGKGTPPTIMESTYVNTYVGGITSGTINFRNPLNEKILISVELKCDEWPGTFGLLNKKDKYPVEPLRNLLIPFTFSPQKLTKYYADIYVYISKTLFWRYPIEGITEVKSKGIDYVFKTKAKKMLEQKVHLDLSNLPNTDINREDFSFLMKIKEEKYRSLILKCLTVEVDKTRSKDNTNNANNKLTLNIKFYPLRPFKTDCEFILSKNSGGQWIYNIILEASEPEPDDIIHIQSSLGKLSHVSFKLQNIFTKNAKFVAYFSHDSTSEFSVSPREGVLDQSGREGTTFLVSYLPVEYGKVKIGKLIIETDEIQWYVKFYNLFFIFLIF